MDAKPTLIATADAWCAATGMSKARLATLVVNDGKFFARLDAGGSCTLRTFERAMRWFSTHWPEAATWPAGVPRPHPIAAA
jgi:hypothetical protein